MGKRLDFLNEITPLYLQKGYQKLKLDDIATELSISKKTIYKYYNSKDSLLKAIGEHMYHYIESIIAKCEKESTNVVDLFYRMKIAIEKAADVEQQRNFISKVAKFDDSMFSQTIDFSNKTIFQISNHAVQKCIEADVLHEGYDIDTINHVFTSNYASIILYTEYESIEQFKKTEKMWFYMHLRGNFNEKGIKMLDEYVEQHPEVLY